jgi:hypothetical protein
METTDFSAVQEAKKSNLSRLHTKQILNETSPSLNTFESEQSYLIESHHPSNLCDFVLKVIVLSVS